MENHNFILYRKYSRKDVLKVLNWTNDVIAQNIGGYISTKTKDEFLCPIFVTYEKSDKNKPAYKDFFIDNVRLNWMSKKKRKISSPDVQDIINQDSNKIQLFLFVKKNDSEGTDYYYMGTMKTVDNSAEQTRMETGESVVNIKFDMDTPVPQNMYNYLEGFES